ncbi:lipopolysaccharide biosynthesis protein [Mycobacterium sp. CBMA 234]|uniref:lipopolysaccharide biosynthesis protein n=1 Tax=Mycolicibacterium sp. CBMA 234 TaxID=1918495 RepID=UPI0012DDA87E|nr:lipopolysaccharide biosynthesis protein [Mycolicibacterium sp. CBMA 234]MUL64002.1 lipopolysaccharide biosynthesis protein [Mycolicibacterium sp. CBMA 234]
MTPTNPPDPAIDSPDLPAENNAATTKPTNLGRQTLWNYAVFAISKSSTLLMTVVVARLLTPDEFGIFALALLLVNLFDYVKDLGVAEALIQSDRPWSRIAPTGLTLSIGFGVLAGAVLAATAGTTAKLLHHPDLVPLIHVLAIALVISAASVVPLSWLRRDLSFQRRLLPEFVGAVVKTTLTIYLAATGHGVWSLVYGQLAGVLITAVMYWWAAPTFMWPSLQLQEAKALLRFGIPVTGVTLLAYAIYNVDYLAIGTRLGTTELGLYTLAYRVPELVVLNLCSVISDVLFSSMSRLQDDRGAMSWQYQKAWGIVLALTTPAAVGLAVVAGPLLRTMYGTQYDDAKNILVVLALYTGVYSASYHAGDVLKAAGRPGLLTAINAARLVLLVGPIWWAAGHSATLVAVALLSVEVVHFAIRMTVVRRVIPLGWMKIFTVVGRPLAATIPMGATLFGLSFIVGHWPAPAQLALLVPLGMVIYAAALCVTAPQLARPVVNRLAKKMRKA